MIKLSKTKSIIGEIINIGSNKEISIGNIFNKIKKITSSKSHLKVDLKRVRPKKSEVLRLLCDNRKIKKLINYKPKINFDTGLNLTIQWFKKEKTKNFINQIFTISRNFHNEKKNLFHNRIESRIWYAIFFIERY